MVSGEYDKITPAKLGREAADMSEQMQYVLMRNTAHFPMLEDAERYLQIIRSFLSAGQPMTA